MSADILQPACERVLERGESLGYTQILAVLRASDDQFEELLALAHEVRLSFNGPEVEIEGIVSIKSGGYPEDCHFCSQSGQSSSPVRWVWLDIPELVRATRQTGETGAREFCIVTAARGPDANLMTQVRAGLEASRARSTRAIRRRSADRCWLRVCP